MKKIIAAILALCIVGGSLPKVYSDTPKYTITASAEGEYEEVTEGSLTYLVYEDHAELAQCDENAEGEIIIPEKFNGVPVTIIGYGIFWECPNITSIEVSENNDYYTSIDGVLFNKDKTTLIQYPTGKESKEYTVPNGVTTIEKRAFHGCKNLDSVTISDSVTSIGEWAFIVCDNLVSVDIPASVMHIGAAAFYGTKWLYTKMEEDPFVVVNGILIEVDDTTCLDAIVIPDTVTTIGEAAFWSSHELPSVTIPDSVTKIEDRAFGACPSLTSITIPDSVIFIGDRAFVDCENLTSVTIGNSVEIIDEVAFSGCSSLESITVPASVKSIGEWAFSDCSSLESITILNPYCDMSYYSYTISNGCDEDTWTYYYEGTIYGYDNSTAQDYAEEHNYKFKSIGEAPVVDGKFRDKILSYQVYEDHAEVIKCDAEKAEGEIIIPDKVKGVPVTSIGNYAFSNCYRISSVIIPDTVTSIGFRAFDGCYDLESINIPSSVTSIDDTVFSDCLSLISIDVSENNDHYTSVEGILFNKDKTNLIKYTLGRETEEYVIPDSVKSIDIEAFAGCVRLDSVTIPDSVTNIGMGAFGGCPNLGSITITNPDCKIYDNAYTISNGYNDEDSKHCYFGTIRGYEGSTAQAYAENYGYKFESLGAVPPFEGEFKDGALTYQVYEDHAEVIKCDKDAEGELIIPDMVKDVPVTSIGIEAFRGIENLTSIIIPDSVTTIGTAAFHDCSNLESVTIPDSVTKIGYTTFCNCSSLMSITIPDSVTSIDMGAFAGCTSLKSVTIPDSVTQISDAAFSNCADLISITFLNPNCDIPNTPSAISNGYDMDKNEQYYSGTIRGYDDSTAQAYAEKRGYIFESLGAAPISDSKYKNLGKITDDDKISVADAADVLKECASLSKGTPNYSEEKKRNADLDFNTKITVNDASLVLRYSAYLAKGPKDVMDCKTWLASVGVLPDEEKK